MGGGFISFEFAHIAARAGAIPTIIDRDPRPLKGFDPDLVEQLITRGESAGIELRRVTTLRSVETSAAGYRATIDQEGVSQTLDVDLIVHGAGRVPHLSGLVASVDWPLLVAVLAAASMTLGNLAAFWQTDVRRLMGWSTVSQVGYLLLPVAVAGRADLALPSLLLYLAGYAATNITAFAVIAALPTRRTVADYRGVAAAHPWLAGALVVSLLGFVGTPPTAVFVGKLLTFTAAWDGGLAWLVVVAAVNTVASLFYYLRWLAPMFSRGHTNAPPRVAQLCWASRAAVTSALAVLIIGIAAGPVLAAFDTPLAR